MQVLVSQQRLLSIRVLFERVKEQNDLSLSWSVVFALIFVVKYIRNCHVN